MYKVGLATPPDEKGDYDLWTLDIDYHIPEDEDSHRYPLMGHGAQIQINGESLAVCVLKAHVICEALNSDGISMLEILVNLMDKSKVVAKTLEDE